MNKFTTFTLTTLVFLSTCACSERTITQQAKSTRAYLVAVSNDTQQDIKKEMKKYPKGTRGRYSLEDSLESVQNMEKERLEELDEHCFNKETRSDLRCLIRIRKVAPTVENIAGVGSMYGIKNSNNQEYLLEKIKRKP